MINSNDNFSPKFASLKPDIIKLHLNKSWNREMKKRQVKARTIRLMGKQK